jgi:hypothetical protein
MCNVVVVAIVATVIVATAIAAARVATGSTSAVRADVSAAGGSRLMDLGYWA